MTANFIDLSNEANSWNYWTTSDAKPKKIKNKNKKTALLKKSLKKYFFMFFYYYLQSKEIKGNFNTLECLFKLNTG